jgi:hypothetical protein
MATFDFKPQPVPWREYLTDAYMPVVDFPEIHPVSEGVYFIFDSGSMLCYVGLGTDIYPRIKAHAKRGIDVAFYGAIEVPQAHRLDVETAYITALKPQDNAKHLGCGERWQRQMVAEIRRLWGANLVQVPERVIYVQGPSLSRGAELLPA